MSDDLTRPPPYPVESDSPTEPGIGHISLAAHLSLRAENMRLRKERNAARAELDEQLRASMPPTPRQRLVVGTVKWTGVASLLLTALAEVASMYRPDVVGPIRTLVKLLGGLG